MGQNERTIGRRGFLLAAGGGAAVLGLPWAVDAAHAEPDTADAAPGGAERIVSNWRQHLLGAQVDPAVDVIAEAIADLESRAQVSIDQISDAPDRLFADVQLIKSAGSPTGSGSSSFQRLQVMAESWGTTGSTHEGSSELATQIVAGVRKVHDLVYNADQPPVGGWWGWEVGAAQALMNTAVIMGNHIGAELLDDCLNAIDHFIPDSHLTRHVAANRVDLCQSVFLRGALGNRPERIELAQEKLLEVFAYTESMHGFYRDGSYIDHNDIAYTGAYGVVFLRGFVSHVAMLSGSDWELPGDATEFVTDLVDGAFSPVVFNGLVFDNVRGRAIGREHANSRDDGNAIVALIAQLSQALDSDRSAEWRRRVQGWMDRDPGIDPRLAEPDAGLRRTLSEVASMHRIYADGEIAVAPEPSSTQVFGGMARAVHRRPGWAATVSMSSHRVAHYEGYTENLRGWHTGSGVLHLHNDDGHQYTDAYWPTVDPYHLPGTTVAQRELVDGQNGGDRNKDLPATDWAGGAVLDRTWGAVGMELDGFGSHLTAKKSWFMLDGHVLALGSDIDSPEDLVQIAPAADTYVNAGSKADLNFGSASTMFTKTASPEYTRESLIRFPAATGAEHEDSRTTLNLHAYGLDSTGTDSILAVYEVIAPWDEAEVTWNSKPALGARIATLEIDGERTFRELDISDHARTCALEGRPIDLVLVPDHPDGMPGVSVTIATRESTQGPFLAVSVPSQSAVHTTIENRLLHEGESPVVLVDGSQVSTTDIALPPEQTHWMHQVGVGGSVWLGGTGQVVVSRNRRTGAWRDINEAGSRDPITRDYVSMIVDHGNAPTDASYAYAVLPTASAAETREFSEDPPVNILANTSDLHAVGVPSEGLLAVNFWAAGSVGGLTVDSACSVVMRGRGREHRLAVARPDFGTDPVEITIRGRGFRTVIIDDGEPQSVGSARGVTTFNVPIKEIGQSTLVRLLRR